MSVLCRLVHRKTLLLVGQVICAVSAAAFGFVIFLNTSAAFLWVCLALRVVNGIGSAAVDTSSFAIISRQASPPGTCAHAHTAEACFSVVASQLSSCDHTILST